MQWYLSVLKKYALFTGRARRKEYWMFGLMNFIVLVIISIIDGILGTAPVLNLVYALAIFMPSLAEVK